MKGTREQNTAITPPADKGQIPPTARRDWLPLAAGVTSACLLIALIWQTVAAASGKMHFTAGTTALGRGEPDVAINELTAALNADSQQSGARLFRAMAYGRHDEPEKAVADYTIVLSADKNNINALLGRASQNIKLKEYSRAAADCDAALNFDAGCLDAYRLRAAAELKSGDYAGSVKDCRQYLKLAGNGVSRSARADVLTTEGLAHLKINEFGDALFSYSKAIDLDKKNGGLYAGRAEAFKQAGDWNNALLDCNRAVNLGAPPGVYRLRALCLAATGKTQLALADINTAIKLAPQNLELYRQRGTIELAAGDYAHALSDFEFVLQRAPGDPQARQNYEIAFQHAPGSHKRLVIADLKDQTDAEPPRQFTGDAATLVATGYKLLQEGDAEGAVEALTAAVKKDPNDADARLYLAHALVSTGKSAAAAEQFGVVASLHPLSPQDTLLYAEALRAAGYPDKAIAVYQGYLDVHPASADARLALIDLYKKNGLTAKATKIASEGIQRAVTPRDKQLLENKLKEISNPNQNSADTSKV